MIHEREDQRKKSKVRSILTFSNVGRFIVKFMQLRFSITHVICVPAQQKILIKLHTRHDYSKTQYSTFCSVYLLPLDGGTADVFNAWGIVLRSFLWVPLKSMDEDFMPGFVSGGNTSKSQYAIRVTLYQLFLNRH